MTTELRLAHTRERELNLKVLTAGRCRAGISDFAFIINIKKNNASD